MRTVADVDILIPTCDRPAALAATLATLIGQTYRSFRIVVSDQTEDADMAEVREVQAVCRVLRRMGRPVEIFKHLPRRGLAEQRQFLLDQASANYVLYLDDDVLCEPDLVERLLAAIRREGCGFIGSFVNAPSALDSGKPVDVPPEGMTIEAWDGPVRPETVQPGSHEWDRRLLHFAAYLALVGDAAGLTPGCEVLYKVAWVGGCVLFDAEKLRACGGFSFWSDLPPQHCGEDALAQLRVMAEYGGAGLAPSGAWHQEVPTTSPDRRVDAPLVLPLTVPHGEARP